jgi:hypothetical protein
VNTDHPQIPELLVRSAARKRPAKTVWTERVPTRA